MAKKPEPPKHERLAAAFHLLDLSMTLGNVADIESHLNLLRDELAPVIEELKAKEKCNVGKHKFTPIATAEPDGPVWRWCIRCGRLRLVNEVFTPGRGQSETVISDAEMKKKSGT